MEKKDSVVVVSKYRLTIPSMHGPWYLPSHSTITIFIDHLENRKWRDEGGDTGDLPGPTQEGIDKLYGKL